MNRPRDLAVEEVALVPTHGPLDGSPYRANSALMVAQALVQRLVGALSTVALAHVLSPALLGAYSITAATANGAYGLLRLGVDAGAHVLAAGEVSERSSTRQGEILGLAFVVTLALSSVGVLGCLTFGAWLAPALFQEPQAGAFAAIAGMLLLGQAVTQWAFIGFGGLHRYGGYVAVTTAGAPVVAGLAVASAWIWGAVAAAAAFAVGQALLSAVVAAVLWRTARGAGVAIRPNLRPSILAEVLRIGLPFYLAGLLLIPVEYLSQAALARSHGLAALGELRIALTVASLVTVIPAALNGPMISALSRLHAADGDLADAMYRNLRVAWTLALAVGAPLALLWPLVVGLLFGSRYDGAAQTGVLAVLAAAAMCLRHPLANGLLASGRQRLLLAISALEAAILGLLAVLLVPRLGLSGYLLAYVAAVATPLAGAALLAQGLSRARLAAAALLSGGGFGIAIWTVLTEGAGWTFATAVVAAVLLVWPWAVLEPAERRAMWRFGRDLADR